VNSRQLTGQRDYFNLVHGVTVRSIGVFGDSDLDFRPQPTMRTPRELIFHVYAQEQALAEAAQLGKMTLELANRSNPEDPATAQARAALRTVRDTIEYAQRCHADADRIARSLSDEALARGVESPFGTFPAWQYFMFASDEHWHHRGQLYTYLRLLGKEPVMLYDYAAAV